MTLFLSTMGTNRQGCFFIADPIFALKFLILDSKSGAHYAFDVIPNGLKKLLIPIPWLVIPDLGAVIPDPVPPL